MSAAHGGQIVTSSAFRQLLPSVGFRDLGRHRLKDLASAERLVQLDDGDFPRLRTLNAVHHNLPVERTSLVGRAEEIERLIGLVEAYRLVSVIGIGGTGKTRLATAAAAEIAETAARVVAPQSVSRSRPTITRIAIAPMMIARVGEPATAEVCSACSHCWLAGEPTFGRCFGFPAPLRRRLPLLPMARDATGQAALEFWRLVEDSGAGSPV